LMHEFRAALGCPSPCKGEARLGFVRISPGETSTPILPLAGGGGRGATFLISSFKEPRPAHAFTNR
jgi:hypothetical protein